MRSLTEPQGPQGAGMDALLGRVRESSDELEREWAEIDQLLRKSGGELEEVAQRNARAAGKLKRVQDNLEAVGSQEIRQAIGAAQEAQAKLFTMKSRVEQLQAKHEVLGRMRKALQAVLEALEGATGGAGVDEPAAPQGGVARVIQAQEEERQRLARQMHDGPTQSLTNLILQAEICERLFEKDPERAREELGALKGDVSRTFERIRAFIFELRPMILDDLGLFPALRRYLKTFQEEHGIEVELSTGGESEAIADYVEVTAFRLIQEALINAARHGQVSRIELAVRVHEGEVTAEVRDDGRGFDVEAALAGARERKTLGLGLMQERAAMLGGRVEFESEPGAGACVLIEIPAGR